MLERGVISKRFGSEFLEHLQNIIHSISIPDIDTETPRGRKTKTYEQ
jgi:hypothetical protein